MEETLKSLNIDSGTLIDNISAGKGLKIFKILNLKGETVFLFINAPGERFRVKDLIAVKNCFLGEKETLKVALISPGATVRRIENFELKPERHLEIPKHVTDLFKCPNSKCITNKEREPVKPSFTVTQREPLKLKCDYCDRYLSREEVEELIVSGK